jgi:hypothetical protein
VNEDHDPIRALVAELDLGRLAPAQRRAAEDHLAGCAPCAEFLADVREIRQQVREGGEAMFEPHPEPAALREYARGHGGPGSSIGRHIRICGVCRLEVETWRGRGAASPAPQTQAAGRAWARLGLATAAALVVGVAVGWQCHLLLGPKVTEPSPTDEPARTSMQPSGEVAGERSGGLGVPAPILHLLPGLLRGEPPSQRWTLDPGESSIGVAVPISLPASTPDTDRYRFELLVTGNTETVWSQELTAARIRQHLEAAEMVNLVVAPSRLLPAGKYEFRVVPAAATESAPIYRARIDIAYRQSPAATKAPQ